jgi:hypothetical protein
MVSDKRLKGITRALPSVIKDLVRPGGEFSSII